MSLMGWIEWIGKGVDVAGVAAIIPGILYAGDQWTLALAAVRCAGIAQRQRAS